MYENPSRSFAQTFRFALLHVFRDFDLRGHASIICRAGNFAVVVHGVIELDQGGRARVCVDACRAFFTKFRGQLQSR